MTPTQRPRTVTSPHLARHRLPVRRLEGPAPPPDPARGRDDAGAPQGPDEGPEGPRAPSGRGRALRASGGAAEGLAPMPRGTGRGLKGLGRGLEATAREDGAQGEGIRGYAAAPDVKADTFKASATSRWFWANTDWRRTPGRAWRVSLMAPTMATSRMNAATMKMYT